MEPWHIVLGTLLVVAGTLAAIGAFLYATRSK